MFGAMLAFGSAAFFGLNTACIRRGVLKSTVLQAMAITVPLGVPLFLAFAAAMGGFTVMRDWQLSTWLLMALAGIVHLVIGRYGNYRATQALGAALSTPVQQLSILVALALAFFFLGETVNAVNAFGILLVLVGPMAVVRRKGGKAAKGARANSFEPDYLPGFFWGLVCALGYGSSPLLISWALEAHGGYGNSVAGGLVSYVAATVAVGLMVMAVGGRGYMATLDRGSGGWYLVSSVLVAFSQLFRYLALAVAPVSVVVPIQRLSVIFRVLFSGVINREHEVLDGWILLSILLSIVGAVAITLDTAWMLEAIGLPAPWIDWLSAPLV
ncbi:EamA-like transporter family protein [Hartmannibacter diazotrophicus]|uniref:EamA-like transporter family protein n=1 Tax=Hartmannibacter diazotrophicus TaxID=1482074 RepID=A0A2C9DC54_9HYPH|nr:DMT family transporter [Hartmannibacter diazotrophicus]SON57759.1 EamA-like transporter family protein [Hartmannibacter diazotrophicus]